MIYKRFKCSAIHNLLITSSSETETLNEGIVIPKRIMEIVDIYNGQEIILTRVGAGNWKNRIRTFVIEGQDDNKVEIRGSLTKFLEKGDLTCIIAEAYLNESELDEYNNQEFAIFDLGFDPRTNTDNSICTLDLQYANKKHRNIDITSQEFKEQKEKRTKLLKVFSQSIILGLKINKTHPDCLQGSAELPLSVMNGVKLQEYKSVSVYNVTQGGVADTYAVPMPEGVVMTTGAMASFAAIDNEVNVVSYILSEKTIEQNIVVTDGTKICK